MWRFFFRNRDPKENRLPSKYSKTRWLLYIRGTVYDDYGVRTLRGPEKVPSWFTKSLAQKSEISRRCFCFHIKVIYCIPGWIIEAVKSKIIFYRSSAYIIPDTPDSPITPISKTSVKSEYLFFLSHKLVI